MFITLIDTRMQTEVLAGTLIDVRSLVFLWKPTTHVNVRVRGSGPCEASLWAHGSDLTECLSPVNFDTDETGSRGLTGARL